MFNSLPPPPPPTYTTEHRPLRLSPNPAPVLPTGECRFILLHPSIPNQRCSCQGFHHNRSVPGSSCECGHQACYHVHNHVAENVAPFTSHAALLDKVRKLEQTLKEERLAREVEIREERRAREKDIRILREAMYPFYRSSDEITKRHTELEDKVEGLIDQQLHVQDRVIAIDDATMALETRVTELEEGGGSPKKRRKSQQIFTFKEHKLDNREEQKSDPIVEEPTDSRNESNAQSTAPYGTQSLRSPSPPPSEGDERPKSLHTPTDFATPFEFIKSYAPISKDIDTYDTPSPVDLLTSLVSKPMKQQIAELDKSTKDAADLTGKKRKRVMAPPDKLPSLSDVLTGRD